MNRDEPSRSPDGPSQKLLTQERRSARMSGMAMLPFSPTPFFADKNRAFWRLQIIGWGGAMMVRGTSSLANQRPLDFFIIVLIVRPAGIFGGSARNAEVGLK